MRKVNLARLDKELLGILQFDFPLVQNPYKVIGESLGINEDKAITRIKKLKKQGSIKYIGPMIDMTKLGFESTLIAANVPKNKLNKTVKIINALDNVTHNYLRDSKVFNLWFTLSAPKGKLNALIERIKALTKVSEMISLEKESFIKLDTRFKL